MNHLGAWYSPPPKDQALRADWQWHHMRNTCSKTEKARRWRAWVKMEGGEKERERSEISFGHYEFEKMAEG